MTSRAVLWGVDGTLIDSEEYHWLAWRDTLAERSWSAGSTRSIPARSTDSWRGSLVSPGGQQHLRIADFEVIRLRGPELEQPIRPAWAPGTEWRRRDAVIVKLTTDDGLVGWGAPG